FARGRGREGVACQQDSAGACPRIVVRRAGIGKSGHAHPLLPAGGEAMIVCERRISAGFAASAMTSGAPPDTPPVDVQQQVRAGLLARGCWRCPSCLPGGVPPVASLEVRYPLTVAGAAPALAN